MFSGSFDFHNYSNFRGNSTKEASSKTRQVVYVSECKEEDKFLKYRIRGPAFLQHQIRAIVGVSLGVAALKIPLPYAVAALVSREKLGVPLAPASGLVLTNTYFDNGESQDALMSLDEMQEAKEFSKDRILPAIMNSFEEFLDCIVNFEMSPYSLKELHDMASNAREKIDVKEGKQHQYLVLRRHDVLNGKKNLPFSALLPRKFGTDLCRRYPEVEILYI